MPVKNSFDRRGFLKSSVLGASGLVATTAAISHAENFIKEEKKEKIIYRNLGKTGLQVPIVSMGVMRADNPNLVKAALKTGVLHLDTAYVYQNGRNEQMLGKLLKEYPRDSYIIATKIKGDGFEKWSDDKIKEEFLKKFSTSLERLQLDYVDILYLHSSKSAKFTLYPPFIEALKELKESGKTKFVGVSTHSNEPEVVNAAVDSEFYDVVLTAYNFQQKHIDELKKSIDRAAKAGLGIVAMKTMAGGFFDKDRQEPVNAKAALKWAMQNENIHTSIPGFTSFDQIEDDWSVMEGLTLTQEERKDLRLSFNKQSMFCNNCDKCLPQCPYNLPIPDVMRSYMYAYGYKNLEKSYDLLKKTRLPANACELCDECSVECTQQFDVGSKIKDIKRLLNVPQDFVA
jgi:predicted aldo/keto reductase-like oxidoreductase